MNSYTILFGFISLFALAASSPSEKRFCKNDLAQCLNDKDCCEGCCVQNTCETFYWDGQCNDAKQVCDKDKKCPEGQVCYPEIVNCIMAPCPPLHACVDPKNSTDH